MSWRFENICWKEKDAVSFEVVTTNLMAKIIRLFFKNYERKFVSGDKGNWIVDGVKADIVTSYWIDAWHRNMIQIREHNARQYMKAVAGVVSDNWENWTGKK